MTDYDKTSFSTGRLANVAAVAAALVAEIDTLDSTTEAIQSINITREGVLFTGTIIHLEA